MTMSTSRWTLRLPGKKRLVLAGVGGEFLSQLMIRLRIMADVLQNHRLYRLSENLANSAVVEQA